MDPNQQPPVQPNNPVPAPEQPVDPLAGYGEIPQAAGGPAGSFSPTRPLTKKNRLPFIIAGVLVGLLLIATAIALLTSKDPTPSNNKSQSTTAGTEESTFLLPATAIGVEQTSNSISQDLSGLNDDTQLLPTKIDDKALGL